MSRIGLFGQISEINDHLYLSGAGCLRPEKLKQKKISCVINATTEEPNAYLQGIDCIKIRIEDNPYAQISNYFDEVADKIRSVKERGGKTLVHCVAGVSRSATLCIVYLLKYERMSLRQAYHYVKSARPIIRPNIGFWKQMADYERKLRGHSSVSMLQVENCPLPFPDVYSSDLRKHMLQNPGPAHNDPQVVAAAAASQNRNSSSRGMQNGNHNGTPLKATLIPIDIVGKRREGGSLESLRNRHSSFPVKTAPGLGLVQYGSWRNAAHPANGLRLSNGGAFSTAPGGRRSHHQGSGNLFSNLLNGHGREAFFSAF